MVCAGTAVNIPIAGVHVRLDEKVLHVQSETALRVVSSAVVGGEVDETRHILNMHVHKGYRSERPADDLLACAHALGIRENFVGMMTAAKLERARCVVEQSGGLTVAVLITLGLTNPMAAGVSEPGLLEIGTINLIVLMDADLSAAALINAVMTATEAKTLALIDGGARTRDGGPATGTSTDAIAVACTGRGEPVRYAGTATEIGYRLGRAVRRGVQETMALIHP